MISDDDVGHGGSHEHLCGKWVTLQDASRYVDGTRVCNPR